MAKQANQRLKLLYLARILTEETDDEHMLTLPQIQAKLEERDIHADRKTLYGDFEDLRHFGMDVISVRAGRDTFYHLGERTFELSELKLLVDSVQSARFITDRKSKDLIRKLETLTSRPQASQLQRQVTIAGRIKSMNESIYYNVDKLHTAITGNRQIRFRYYQWNTKKEMVLRRGGAWYRVSPWGLLCDNENYYLIAFDGEDGIIKHYRLDKMLSIEVLEEGRCGAEAFDHFDLPRYSRSLFGMFAGEEKRVTLEAVNSLAGVLIDRFGRDIPILSVDEEHFQTSVSVVDSRQFLGWIIGLGEGIRVVAPEALVGRFREEGRRLLALYGGQDGL